MGIGDLGYRQGGGGTQRTDTTRERRADDAIVEGANVSHPQDLGILRDLLTRQRASTTASRPLGGYRRGKNEEWEDNACYDYSDHTYHETYG